MRLLIAGSVRGRELRSVRGSRPTSDSTASKTTGGTATRGSRWYAEADPADQRGRLLRPGVAKSARLSLSLSPRVGAERPRRSRDHVSPVQRRPDRQRLGRQHAQGVVGHHGQGETPGERV